MPPKGQKEAIVAVVDVGQSVSQSHPDRKPFLEEALHCVSMIFQRKIFSESKDEVALVLFGTENTVNQLSDDGQYQHISVPRGLEQADWDLLHYVTDSVKGTSIQGDWMDAVVVAMDMIKRESEAKSYSECKILLLTDFAAAASDDGVEQIIEGLKALSIQLIVIGPDIMQPKAEGESDDDEEGGGGARGQNGRMDSRQKKPKTQTQMEGEALIANIIGEVDGALLSFDDALPQLLFFQTKSVRPTPWNVFLQIGPDLSIPISGYIKIREAKLKSWKVAYAKDDSQLIVTEKTYYKADEDKTNVDKEDVIPGYRYGATLVPFSDEVKMNQSYESGERCLTVLAFASTRCIPRHLYLGEGTVFIYPRNGDQVAGVALSALIHALYDQDMVAVARRVYAKNNSPQIGFLAPRIKADEECLVWVQMPYAEDIRQYTFPSLPPTDTMRPSQEQLDCIDALIDSSDLMTASRDDDGEESEAVKSKNILDVAKQRVFQCLSHRALHPGEPLPSLDPHLQELLTQPEEIQKKCIDILKKLEKCFSLQKLEKKRKVDKTGAAIFDDEEEEKSKKVKPDADALDDADMAGLASADVTCVGTVKPAEDFQILITRSGQDFSEVCQQLQKIIQQLVLESLRNQLYAKALECVKALRKASKERAPSTYNTWIPEFRDTLLERSRRDFWDDIVSESLGLITHSESAQSNVTEETARDFLKVKDEAKSQDETPVEDDADDLLDEL